ncbi:hypothetical protein ACFYPT_35525 [Streptomyces sp. NPDC005529]
MATNALIRGSDYDHGCLVKLDADEDFVRLEVHDRSPPPPRTQDRKSGRD